jgi:hypothetical protein
MPVKCILYTSVILFCVTFIIWEKEIQILVLQGSRPDFNSMLSGLTLCQCGAHKAGLHIKTQSKGDRG